MSSIKSLGSCTVERDSGVYFELNGSKYVCIDFMVKVKLI